MTTEKSSQIIALGGGGVGLDKFNLAIDNYKIKASGEKIPKIAFLPTAVGDSAFAIEKFDKNKTKTIIVFIIKFFLIYLRVLNISIKQI